MERDLVVVSVTSCQPLTPEGGQLVPATLPGA